MNFLLKPIQFLLIPLFAIMACNQSGLTNGEDSALKKNLVEQEIEGINYKIALPKGYQIIERRGIDFSVYYFSPVDTTDMNSFRGGFYIGNAGGGFGPESSTCKTSFISSALLGISEKWSVYNCNGKQKIETITKSKTGISWAGMIHAFGSANSNEDLTKLLEVYSTLNVKSK
ncbi:hypothetical protein ACFQZS_10505 [Mucilaginibacter calamicampi]|uniref:DUF4136 domain-containing protein n=1 Tax=Mucilaginibacter calamicampi TaxID=1302352 RepID=A0ABW2YWT8_9SPHI